MKVVKVDDRICRHSAILLFMWPSAGQNIGGADFHIVICKSQFALLHVAMLGYLDFTH